MSQSVPDPDPESLDHSAAEAIRWHRAPTLRRPRGGRAGRRMIASEGERVPLALVLAEGSRWAAARDDLDSSLRPLVEVAVATVSDFASVTRRHGDGSFSTWASSDARATAADALQYELAQGPCLDASVATGWVTSRDVTRDPRWREWTGPAAALGIQSVLSVHLYTDAASLGSLNLYGAACRTYTSDDCETATLIGAHASVALARFAAD